MIPAFAMTMSTWPNSAMPSLNTFATADLSRTSASRAMMRPPALFTSRSVSARSSLVLIGYKTESTWAQMSNVTMSAPSEASRTACDRPCPRAPPEMNATLPSNLFIELPLEDECMFPVWGLAS
jgi:hypothetical protein